MTVRSFAVPIAASFIYRPLVTNRMADTTEYVEPTGTEADDFDRLFGIVADGVIGAAGGLVGTALMMGVLFVAAQVGAFDMGSFTHLAETLGLGGFDYANLLGILIFFGNGMIPFPLLFASLMEYLPGRRLQVSGMFFGAVLWTGFVFAFYEGYTGLSLALYLGFTFVGHVLYGFGLGQVFEYLSNRPDSLV